MRTQVHAGQLEKVREEVPNIHPSMKKNPASSRREKKRERDLKKMTDGENTHTHTHTHNARASQKCVLKNALQIMTTVNVPVLLIL